MLLQSTNCWRLIGGRCAIPASYFGETVVPEHGMAELMAKATHPSCATPCVATRGCSNRICMYGLTREVGLTCACTQEQ